VKIIPEPGATRNAIFQVIRSNTEIANEPQFLRDRVTELHLILEGHRTSLVLPEFVLHLNRLFSFGTKSRQSRGQKEGHVTYFQNFETTSISREWLKLETSNLASRLTRRGSYQI